MSEIVVKVESLSKQYRLGEVSTGAIKDDIKRWRYKMMGKEDPFLKVGEVNDRTIKGASDYVWALKDIDFDVKKGEILGIIGRNGAGKSTLLKILSRTTTPTKGCIKMKGRIASLLEVGTGFHPELSGRDNIFLNGAILGMTKKEIKNKFDEIVDFSGVERYIDTPVKRYSSGMYVRLAFGVAAHLESEILIVDEVLAVGDAEFQKKCLGKMGEVSKKDGKTVLFVSHNMVAIRQLCSRGILLNRGAVTFDGSSEIAVQHYMESNVNEHRVSHVKFEQDERPSGEFAELIEYSLKDDNNNIINKFNLYEDVKIEMIFKIKKNGLKCYPNIHFFNQQDQYLFVTSTSDDEVIEKTGVYKTTFFIKANTFNTAIYKVSIAITCYPGTDVQFHVNPAIIFEVEEANLELRGHPYTGPVPGDFRFRLPFETVSIN